jgi:hypothetical protein
MLFSVPSSAWNRMPVATWCGVSASASVQALRLARPRKRSASSAVSMARVIAEPDVGM